MEGTAAYSSIAALPSATVAVRRGDGELGRVRWGDVERDGRADAGQCRAVRSGRTFLSGGPLVTLSVDGREPGGTVELRAGAAYLAVEHCDHQSNPPASGPKCMQ